MRVLLSLAVLSLLGTAALAQAPDRADAFGDALPHGAVARLGSVRFHHDGGVLAAAFVRTARPSSRPAQRDNRQLSTGAYLPLR